MKIQVIKTEVIQSIVNVRSKSKTTSAYLFAMKCAMVQKQLQK